jgi:hypothetical protein
VEEEEKVFSKQINPLDMSEPFSHEFGVWL